jgi:glycosyltransferase involved in cell wall biosynthesis
MKIAVINHGQVLGGAQISLNNSLQTVYDNHEVKFINFYTEAKNYHKRCNQSVVTNPVFREFGSTVIGWSDLTSIRTYLRILREFLNFYPSIKFIHNQIKNYHIIYFNSSVLILPLIILKLFNKKKKFVLHIRETFKPSILFPLQLFFKYISLRLSDSLISVTQYDKDQFWNNHPKIKVIRNGVDLNLLKSSFSPIESHEYDVINLGGWIPRKGAVEFLRLARNLPKCKFLITGCNEILKPCRPSLTKLFLLRVEEYFVRVKLKKIYSWFYNDRISHELLSIDNICQIGFVNSFEFIRQSKIVFFGGVIPHASRPIFEGWLQKKPSIAFNNSALEGDLIDGQNGFYINRGNLHEASKKVNLLLENHSLRTSMGLQGFELVKKEYNSYINSLSFKSHLEKL